MKRKLVKQGGTALTVSLPADWAREYKLKAGDEINALINEDSVIFSVSEKKQKRKEATLNIDDTTYLSLARHMYLLYRTNHDKITLTYSKQEAFDPKKERKTNLKVVIRNIVGRLIGAEIISQSSTKTEIECFVTEEKPDLDKIEKRIYFLTKETTNEMLQAIGPNYHDFHITMYDHHDNITKFINYFLRELYKSNRSEDEKKIAYAFYTIYDNLVDKLRHISEKIDRFGCTTKLKGYIEEIFDFFYEGFKLLNKKQLSQEFIKTRYDIKERINKESFTAKELRVLAEAVVFLDTLNELTEYILLKSLESKNE